MSFENQEQQATTNNNQRNADAWLNIRVVARDPETNEILCHPADHSDPALAGKPISFWLTQDIPLNATNKSGKPQPTITKMIEKHKANPGFSFLFEGTLSLPGESNVDYSQLDNL